MFELNTSTQCYLSELKPVFFSPANIATIYLLFELYVADIWVWSFAVMNLSRMEGATWWQCPQMLSACLQCPLACGFPVYKVIAPPANKSCPLWQNLKQERSLQNTDGNPTGTWPVFQKSWNSFRCYAWVTVTLLTIINQQRGHLNSYLMVHIANLKQWLNPPTAVAFSHFVSLFVAKNIWNIKQNKPRGRSAAWIWVITAMSNDDLIVKQIQ